MLAGLLLGGTAVALAVLPSADERAATTPTSGRASPGGAGGSAGTSAPAAGSTATAPGASAPVAPDADPREPWSPGTDPVRYARLLFVASSAARGAEGLTPFVWDDCAAVQASARAQALVGAELAHADLEPVLSACGVPLAAENLSRGAVSAQDVVDAWLASPGHRANLLAPDLGRLGVGCAPDADGLTCAQVFLP